MLPTGFKPERNNYMTRQMNIGFPGTGEIKSAPALADISQKESSRVY